ncbi:unnamed protein product [Clonostachys rosea]|uniref:Actin-like ATPase domain-containing protein n=1 Tax=Bionectria ochroleuca TaxID=29856 RepID=A0ABY6V0N0_BIOOC|nr:unnamed protein product [Clonostachys rosea]
MPSSFRRAMKGETEAATGGSGKSSAWSMRSLIKRIKEKKQSDLNDFMVVGIDFGTTYSGAAWATVSDFENEQINLITRWPDAPGEQGKAPTELFYENGRLHSWGYGIPDDAVPISWFKLLLLRDEDVDDSIKGSEYLLKARKELKKLRKTPVELIADYLRELWKHILNTIQKARGSIILEALSFHVVITVPAIWKPYARTGMEEAARLAGITQPRSAGPTTLSFAIEPETAALATLWERGEDLRVGDVYVICDAGGGTVDLITYKVGELDPIQLHEAVTGKGGLCGGIFIDEEFQAICENRLGRRWQSLSQNGIKDVMKTEWEYDIKQSFDPKSTKPYIVAIPAEAFSNNDMNDESQRPYIKSGRIHFSASDIQKAFEGPFQSIAELVDEQIEKSGKKNVKAVTLVGGLGSSSYLQQFLAARYGNKLDVIQATGVKPRTAICRGAIFKGFLERPTDNPNFPKTAMAPMSVVSIIARSSLGVSYSELFQYGVHREEDKYLDESEGVWRAKNQMRWYLKKGEAVSSDHPVRHEFYRSYEDEDEFEGNFADAMLQCDDDCPPERKTSSVKTLCTVNSRLDHISFEDLEDYIAPNGRELKKVSYGIEMVPSGASTLFCVYYGDERLGSENATFDFC